MLYETEMGTQSPGLYLRPVPTGESKMVPQLSNSVVDFPQSMGWNFWVKVRPKEVLCCVCGVAKTHFVRGVRREYGPNVARLALAFLLSSAGMQRDRGLRGALRFKLGDNLKPSLLGIDLVDDNACIILSTHS